jgi:hypothetical protein
MCEEEDADALYELLLVDGVEYYDLHSPAQGELKQCGNNNQGQEKSRLLPNL